MSTWRQFDSSSCSPSSCPPQPCHLSCCYAPSVIPTGATGATGPADVETNTRVLVTAALNVPTLTVNTGVVTRIPYNFVAEGNVLGRAAFDTSTGIFAVPVGGVYRIDCTVSFNVGSSAVAGTGITAFIRQNLATLASATYQFPIGTLAASTTTTTLNSFWCQTFNAGDQIDITVLSNIVATTAVLLNGCAVSGFPPYNTIVSFRSHF